MEEDFEYLINSLKLFSKYPTSFNIDISSNIWSECEKLIENIKNDPETFLILQEYYIEIYRCYLGILLKEYWTDFELNVHKYKENSCLHHCYIFSKIENLFNFLSNWINNPLIYAMFKREEDLNDFINKLSQILYTALTADMPLVFSRFLFNTFTFSLEVWDSIVNKEEKKLKSKHHECPICKFKKNEDNSDCYCENLSKGFISFLNFLRKLRIFHQLCDDIIKSVLYNAIEKHISNLCRDKNFDISCLNLTCSWFENSVIDWLKIIYIAKVDDNKNMIEAVSDNFKEESIKDSIKKKDSESRGLYFKNVNLELFNKIENINLYSIQNFLTNTYIYCRIKQLFDIIIDYPYSEPALLDLHECIKLEPFYREKFTHSLKNAFEIRLLHAGVPTCDIIEAYITAIKALRLLDPQGIILQIVCDPVRGYLRTREDTVRCIITILTNDSLINLENSTGENNLKENLNEDDFNLETWKSWVPQTIGVSRSNKHFINSDIISMLINIFESKDLFVQEYQRLLAEKLILGSAVNLEFELRNLEILSLRFGESDLHNCEVMLKDLKDSERINNRINSDEFATIMPKNFKLNGLILSEQFWPDNLGFTMNDFKHFKLPAELDEVFDSFKKAFETVKVNRTLNWIHQLGTVKLEIEFKNGIQEYSVRPIQAAIIYLFQKQNTWKISALIQELDILPSVLLRNISYWKNIGVLKENTEDCYEIVQDGPSYFKHNPNRTSLSVQEFDMFLEEEENANDQANESNLQIIWNFIDNMLRNLHELSFDRIYSMVKMFNMQSPEIGNLSVHELRQFLDRKVFERKLIYSNGLYDLNLETEE